MPNPIQHNLIDEDTHRAVLADGQEREAEYVTTYDDGTTGITRHMLYVSKKDNEVRSCPIEEWPPPDALEEVP